MRKKFLSLLLAAVMVLAMVPATAWAATVENCDDPDCTHAEAIGTTHYDTFADAVEAAGTTSTTITLLADTKENITIGSGQNITLDLNGKDLTGNVYVQGGELTIADSTADEEPAVSDDYNTVTYTSGCIYGMIEVTLAGKLTVESGKINCSKYAIRIWGDTTGNGNVNSVANINGGYILAPECAVTVQGNGAELNISGGVLVANDNAVVAGNGGTYQGGTTINISGGTLIGHITEISANSGWIACGIYHPQEGTLNISGGVIYADGGVGILMRGGELEMTGGTVIATGTATGYVGDSRYYVNSCAIQIDCYSGYDNIDDCKVEISGGTFISDSDVATLSVISDNNEDSSKMVVKGGEFSSSINKEYLDPSLTTELYSSSNTEAPYSYTTTSSTDIEDILDEVEDGDTITILDREVTSEDEIYSVILNANGGTIGSSSAEEITIKACEDTTIELPTVKLSGYTFKGWYDTTNKITYDAGDTYTFKDEVITLKAQWKEKSSTGGGSSYSLEEKIGGSSSSSDDEEDVTSTTPSTSDTSSIFTDLSTDHPYYDSIMEAYEKGYMVGISDDTFAADGYLTRAMAAQIIWNLAGKPAPEDVAPFIDVTSDAWYAEAVAWCYENGIVIGYDYIHYGPTDYVTMEQFCIMLAKYRGEVVPEYTGNSPYATRGWVAYMITA